MIKIAAEQIGLRDAAELFGVSIDTLRRRIRDNQLDEAVLVQGPFGATWVLPRDALADIAARERWELPDSDVSRETLRPAGLPDESEVAAAGAETVRDPVIDLRRSTNAEIAEPEVPASLHAPEEAATGVHTVVAADDPQVLVRQIQQAIASEVHTALAENVEAELTRVREAITSAEVRAVAAEARTDAIRTEQGRLQAQLKRAEADVEYWRSQHDRLDRELDRERTGRVSAERAKAIAETQASEAKSASVELRVSLAEAQERERALVRQGADVSAELDQAMVAMGWWSRRKLSRIQARTAGRTQPPSTAD